MIRLALLFALCMVQVMGGGFVCNLTCPKGYVFLRRPCLCYHVSKPEVKKTQSEAIKYCQSTGGYLFYMRNCNQLDELRFVIHSEKLIGTDIDSFWTLSKDETEYFEDATYRYYTDPPISNGLLLWLRPDRSEKDRCVSMLLNQRFMNFAGQVAPCSQQKRVICELYPTSN